MATRRRYIDIPDHARRDFIKWTIGLGAALGLRPWKVFEVQESIVGPAVAAGGGLRVGEPLRRVRLTATAATRGTRSCGRIRCRRPRRARRSTPPGKATPQAMTGAGDHAMLLGPDAPKFAGKKMTAFICGSQRHAHHGGAQDRGTSSATGISMFAAAAALQTAVADAGAGDRHRPAAVRRRGGRAGGGVGAEPGGHGRPVQLGVVARGRRAGERVGRGAVRGLLQGQPVAARGGGAADDDRGPAHRQGGGEPARQEPGVAAQADVRPTWRATASPRTRPAKLSSIGNTLITTAKAFSLNLTSHVMMPAFLDDPHGAFQDVATLTATVQAYGKMLDAFMADCMAIDDPMCAGRKIGDNLVMAWIGDTTKDPFTPSGWPDGTREQQQRHVRACRQRLHEGRLVRSGHRRRR